MAANGPTPRPWEDDDRSLRDPRILATGVVLTLLVHAAVAFAFARFDEAVVPVEGAINRGLPLCAGGKRCPQISWHRPRLGIETELPGDVQIIQAAVIPRLGMKEQDPKKLPELQAYEEPEKIEDGVNITDTPPEVPPEQVKIKEFKPKDARLDRRRKARPRSLEDILAGAKDDDPRKRPTRLEEIIGNPGGSIHGSGTEFVEGDAWAGKVTLDLRREFIVPSSIDDESLRRLSVEIAILKISAKGEIERFEVVQRSGNAAYNTAAVQLIKKFMPSEGGSLSLPEPPPKVRSYINTQGMVVVLEGRLFKR